MKKTIEIRSAEGGNDSKLLVKELIGIYELLSKKMKWSFEIKSANKDNFGYSIATIIFQSKKNNLFLLEQEIGCHKYQRVPPTEKNGRVHTSTVTVAVLDENEDNFLIFKDEDFKIEWYSGTGKGGQHRNKHQNSCRLTHIPTGITESRQGRERKKNLESAKKSIIEKIEKNSYLNNKIKENKERRNQIGSNFGLKKIRTIRFQEKVVINNQNNKKITIKEYIKGDIFKLWN